MARPTPEFGWQPGSVLLQTAKRFVHHRLALVGLVIVVLLALGAILADAITQDPYAISTSFRSAPSAEHLLGTDQVGRDVFSRLLHASRVSMTVGIGSSLISISIGTALGALAGLYRGWLDTVLMRLTDMVLSFPAIILIIVVVFLVGRQVVNVVAVLGLLSWPTPARLVRSSVLSLREQDFILSARAMGASNARVLLVHVLPNALSPILVAGSLGAAYAILAEASLSYLGLGVQPPTASWGNMLLDAQSLTILGTMPWMWLPPGLMILLAVLSMNFVGDGIRDALDPRSLVMRRSHALVTPSRAVRSVVASPVASRRS
jgi:peptide/nickel transport system permease protein